MKTKLIVNPVSGTDEGLKVLPAINARLREAGPVDVVLTIGPGDATDAARRAVEEGYERVVSAGGDGTLNEALNGIASVDGGLDAVALGVIPIGTGNDFATALGLPQDAEAAAAMLLEATPAAPSTCGGSTIAASSTCRAAAFSRRCPTPSTRG